MPITKHEAAQQAIRNQLIAADAHADAASAFARQPYPLRKLAASHQIDAAYFARRARKFLFEALGSDPEQIADIATGIVGAAIFMLASAIIALGFVQC